MKIGLYFGSFNPVHVGHMILAQTALNETDLDRVWLVVSPQNPFKKKKNLLPEYDRLRMAELATEDCHHIQASNVEMHLPRPSYTIDTLTYLSEKYATYEFSLIMGGDNLQYLHKWKNYEAILEYYPIYVYPRPGTEPSELDNHPSIRMFEAPLLDISATYIRHILKEGKSPNFLVPEKVSDYILKGNLYAD